MVSAGVTVVAHVENVAHECVAVTGSVVIVADCLECALGGAGGMIAVWSFSQWCSGPYFFRLSFARRSTSPFQRSSSCVLAA